MPVYKDKERGTWFIKCYYTNWDGEKKQKKKRGFTTKKEALEWEHTFLSQEHSETTMSLQSLANLYLSDMGTRLRSSTMSTKQHIIELKILPFFQNKLVSEITPTDIRKWQNQMIAKGYSTTYLKLINTQLVAMLNYAVKYCNLRENPCHKAGTIGKSRAKEMQFWTKEEFYRFLACVENKPTSSEAFQILFWTGIRSGELLALTAEDLDFKTKTIRINKTYQRVHQEDIITEPKTPKSNRLVTIPDFLCRTLKVYVKQRKLQPQDRLFPYTKYYLHHEMDRGCKNSGVPRIRLHDLRHSHASLLIELNFSPLLISERLGHEKIETTLNIYSHLYPNKQAELARTLHSIGTKLNEENNKSVPNQFQKKKKLSTYSEFITTFICYEDSVTIVANQTTQANVRNGKYFREGKITVKVVDAFSAKQTGANKITVTGTNLPTEKADYVLKLGTATKTLKDVVVNEEKTSAVLTTATSTLSDGSYTVTVGENKAEFTCEEAKVASIVIEPENAIIDAKDRKKAYAYYKVYNQFEEDVTELSLGNSDVTITGSDKATGAKGKVTFESTSDYNMNVSQVSLSIVCRTNGVSVTKILTVGEASKLTTVNFEGVYKKNGGTYTKVTSIPEGLAAAGLRDYYLFFTGVDQYELPYDAASIGSSNLSVTLSSATGLTNGTENTTVELDNKEYYAMGLTVTGTPGILASGTVKIMGVVLTSGKNFTSDITVDSSVKIDSIRIFASNGVFGDIENEIDYEILDTNGNSITSIDVLSILNDSKYMKNYPDVKFVGSKDGTAKLKFAPGSVGENGTTVSLSWISPTNKFGYTTLNVRGNQHPKAIIGVDTGLFKASIVATSGGTVELSANNFIYEDQFGNVMSSAALAKNTGYKIEIATAGSIDNSTKLQVTTKAAASVAGKDKVVTATAIDTTNTSASKFIAKLIDTANKEVSGADFEFNIYAVNLDDVSGIAVIPGDTRKASVPDGATQTFGYDDFGPVYGYYGKELVYLQKNNDYKLVGTPSIPAITATEGKVTKETSATIVLNNSRGNEVTVPYSYSNKPVAVISSDAFSFSAPDNQLFAKGYVTLPNTGKITAVSMGALTYTKDLYGGNNAKNNSTVSDCATPRITFSNLPADTTSYEVANNGTTTAMLTFKKAGWYTVKVKYSWNDGFVYETSITFDASAVVTAQ